MSFKKTYVAPFSRTSAPLSADVLYWRKLTPPILLKEINSIDHIDVSPIEPHFIAVTCSSRVQLYHPITRMIHKNYNRFREAAYGAIFHPRDGKLLLVGSEESALKLFDVSSKNLLRVFKGHQRAVHRCAFLPTDNQVASFSDDKIVGLWDIPSETFLHKFEGHSDYVRCGATMAAHPNLIISGSYDHTVKIWDKREKKEILTVNHGSPVEAIRVTPTGALLFSAGSTEIRVWDCLTGGRLLSKISQHHKTITCLRFASHSKRLVSGSLDRHVKIYDMANFEVIQTLDYSSPILSLAISPKDRTVTVGMSDGIIAISRREEDTVPGVDQEKTEQVAKKNRRKSKTFSDFVYTDYGVQQVEATKDLKYDHYLRKFRYSKALDCVLSDIFHNRFPGTTVALFQELIRRDGLRTALAGRNGKHLLRIMKFLIKHLRRPRFIRVLIQVCDVFIDLYASKVGEDPAVDELFLHLCDEVSKEVAYMTDLMEVQGSLDMIMAGAGMSGPLPETTGTPEVTTPRLTSSSNSLPSNRLEPSENAMKALVVSIK